MYRGRMSTDDGKVKSEEGSYTESQKDKDKEPWSFLLHTKGASYAGDALYHWIHPY